MKLRGPAGQVATTEERENLGGKQMREKPATYWGEKTNPLPVKIATVLHWMWKGGNHKERMAVMKKWWQKDFSGSSLLPRLRLLLHAALKLTRQQQFTAWSQKTMGCRIWFLSQPVIIHEETFYISWLPRSQCRWGHCMFNRSAVSFLERWSFNVTNRKAFFLSCCLICH